MTDSKYWLNAWTNFWLHKSQALEEYNGFFKLKFIVCVCGGGCERVSQSSRLKSVSREIFGHNRWRSQCFPSISGYMFTSSIIFFLI